ncbi:MAG TPA: DoxX family protein [Luteimonas sp.]
MNASLSLLGRLGLSLIFITSGWSKIAGYAATQGYMESAGVPGLLLPLVIALELGGGLAILAGLFTRWLSLAFAGFTVLAALLFWKNLAIAGGFLVLAANGPGALSVDEKLAARRAPALAH